MSVDKLVDSTQLDADLTTVANAIRTKGGTSAQLSFPSGMAQAIADLPSGATLQSKTLTLGASAPSTVTPDSGYDGMSSVPVSLDTSVIKAENIAKDVQMLGITGTHEGGGGGSSSIFVNGNLATSAYWKGITYGEGMFVAVSSGGSNIAGYSYDGINWTQTTLPYAGGWFSVAYGKGMFVAVSVTSDCKSAYSYDGINWSLSSMPNTSYRYYSVCYGNGVFVSPTKSGKIAYSTNGINWSLASLPSTVSSTPMATYGNGRFIVVYTNSDKIEYSADGINWSESTGVGYTYRNNIVYGMGKYILAQDGNIKYSADGINWTQVDGISGFWGAVAYGNGLFIAINRQSTGDIIYSTDGINWASGTNVSGNKWSKMEYGGGKFVALEDDTTANCIYCDVIKTLG